MRWVPFDQDQLRNVLTAQNRSKSSTFAEIENPCMTLIVTKAPSRHIQGTSPQSRKLPQPKSSPRSKCPLRIFSPNLLYKQLRLLLTK